LERKEDKMRDPATVIAEWRSLVDSGHVPEAERLLLRLRPQERRSLEGALAKTVKEHPELAEEIKKITSHL
jgi:hypothetical protein